MAATTVTRPASTRAGTRITAKANASNVEYSRYYVDHHEHHLSAPPRGHRWVRHPDGRYILVAVATGIIADILLHH